MFDKLNRGDQRKRLELLLWLRENHAEHLSDLPKEDIEWLLNRKVGKI